MLHFFRKKISGRFAKVIDKKRLIIYNNNITFQSNAQKEFYTVNIVDLPHGNAWAEFGIGSIASLCAFAIRDLRRRGRKMRISVGNGTEKAKMR